VSERNLASPDVWAESLSRSHTRRSLALREARRRLRTRGGVISMVAVVTVMGMTAAFAGAQTTLIKSGASGDAVTLVQQALGVDADGVYGPITKAAVTKYQKKNGLTVDGVVGPETLGSLGIGQAKVQNASYTPASGGGGGGNGGAGNVPAVLERIAQCESGGDPTAVGGGGTYRGKYQFAQETWESVGGKGDPAEASEAEQDKRAMILYERSGTSPWGCA
jgi:peptidoglycan hydrolase-like protein with peptidoglycan-binding domain